MTQTKFDIKVISTDAETVWVVSKRILELFPHSFTTSPIVEPVKAGQRHHQFISGIVEVAP